MGISASCGFLRLPGRLPPPRPPAAPAQSPPTQRWPESRCPESLRRASFGQQLTKNSKRMTALQG
eukprot:496394-Alexandrium_andersonii.AAC.1